METNGNLKFGVDLITLYDPSFWGITDFNSFYDNTVLSPDVFWDRASGHSRRRRCRRSRDHVRTRTLEQRSRPVWVVRCIPRRSREPGAGGLQRLLHRTSSRGRSVA